MSKFRNMIISKAKAGYGDIEQWMIDAVAEFGMPLDNLLQAIGDYNFVDYIRSSGAEKINTEIYYTAKHRVVLDITSTRNDGNFAFFGSSNGRSWNDGEMAMFWANGQFDAVTPISNTGSSPMTFGLFLANHKYRIGVSGKGYFAYADYTNMVSDRDDFYKEYICNKPLYIFATNRGGLGSDWHGEFMCHDAYIQHEDLTDAVFIPCIRKSDGKIGLLNLMDMKLHANIGYGEFVVGDETSLKDKISYILQSPFLQ